MKTKVTGSLIVCLAAAVFAAGALLLNKDSPGPTPTAAAAAAAATVAPASASASGGGGYRAPTGVPGGGVPAVGSAAAAAATAKLEIRNFTFSPVTAGPGGRVSIQSRDSVPHTVTADGGGFDSGRVAPNGTATIVAPKTPGSYRFTCLIHPQMSGTLVVR